MYSGVLVILYLRYLVGFRSFERARLRTRMEFLQRLPVGKKIVDNNTSGQIFEDKVTKPNPGK